jgi:hypothetical protein
MPKMLVQQVVRNTVRLSDADMSGALFGGCVRHVLP